MAIAGPRYKGAKFNPDNGRVDFYYNGTFVEGMNATQVALASGIEFAASSGSLTLAAGEITAGDLSANLKKGFIPLPLDGWLLTASNDIPAIAVASGNGGKLASDTAPKLERVNAATDKKMRISWAASGVIEIQQNFAYPPDLDDTAAITVNLLAGMGGATDTPVIAVAFFEMVGDTNAGGNTAALAATVAQKSVTIAASDVGAYPKSATVTLTPAAHGNDALYVYGAWIEYTRKS